MSDPIPTQIETSIEQHLKSAKLALLDIGRSPDTIRDPAIAVGVVSGNMSVKCGVLHQTHKVIITVAAANIREDGERVRRKILHGLIESIASLVCDQTFGLPIQPLAPGDWKETTGVDELRAGLIMGEVEFSTKSQTRLPSADDAADAITEIVTSFHLGNGTGGLEPTPRVVSIDNATEESP